MCLAAFVPLLDDPVADGKRESRISSFRRGMVDIRILAVFQVFRKILRDITSGMAETGVVAVLFHDSLHWDYMYISVTI